MMPCAVSSAAKKVREKEISAGILAAIMNTQRDFLSRQKMWIKKQFWSLKVYIMMRKFILMKKKRHFAPMDTQTFMWS